ncbi:MAG TPA: phosphatidylglycerophosphatase A [Rhodocyclaceae bacterium]|nr:phosphatidylglycerophosphatase A [Rhodocyclaceae bacterium]
MAKRPPPSLRFLFAHPAHFIACGCGSGLSMWAPGTVGTLFAWMTYVLMKPHIDDLQFGILLGIAYLVGIWVIQKTGRALGEPDHGSIVWDEIVPFWAVLLLTPPLFMWQLTAFCLFRFFDITKPQPARWFDRNMKNGFGVMADDAVAAFYTLLVVAALKWMLG